LQVFNFFQNLYHDHGLRALRQFRSAPFCEQCTGLSVADSNPPVPCPSQELSSPSPQRSTSPRSGPQPPYESDSRERSVSPARGNASSRTSLLPLLSGSTVPGTRPQPLPRVPKRPPPPADRRPSPSRCQPGILRAPLTVSPPPAGPSPWAGIDEAGGACLLEIFSY